MELGPSLIADDLRVVFELRGDRWQHVIERRHGDAWQPMLSSVEGDAADDWPPSPPFQELHRTTLADGRDVILLVGRAGTSHWSGSVEVADEKLIFDIACRHSRVPARLGSEYIRATEGCVIARVGDRGRVVSSDSSLQAFPVEISANAPATTRWAYSIQLLPCP